MRKFVFTCIFLSIGMITAFVGRVFADPTIYGDDYIKSGKLYYIKNLSRGLYLGEDGDVKNQGELKVAESEKGALKWQVNIEEIDSKGRMVVSFVLGDKGLFLTQKDNGYVFREYQGTPDQRFYLDMVYNSNKYRITGEKDIVLNTDMMGITTGDSQEAFWEFVELNDKKSHREVIAHWAPDVYQDFNTVNKEFYNYDYITNFNFDGDWNGFNNWENSANEKYKNSSRRAYVYSSIQETPTHYFLTYNFFHARDVGGTHLAIYAIDSHENDFEGALYAIKKDGSDFGKIELIYTQAHGNHDTYKEGDIKFKNNDKSSGTVELFSSSNGTAVGTHGHSVHMWKNQYPGGIKYINRATGGNGSIGKSEMAEFKTSEDNIYKECEYQIRSLDEFWDRRYEIGNGKTFKGFGSFGSDASGFKDHLGQTMKGSANALWNWDKGLWLSDPAFFMDHNDDFEEMSHKYTFNKYVTHKVVVEKMKANVYKDPKINSKKRADIFVRVQVDGTKYIDIGDYKKSNVDNGVWHNFYFGAEEAEGNAKYTEKINCIFVARNKDKDVIYELRDRDTDADDSMGIIKFNLQRGKQIEFEEDTNNREGSFKGALYTR